MDACEHPVPFRVFIPDDEQRHFCRRDCNQFTANQFCILAER